MTFCNWLWPRRRFQLFSAACASLKIIASAVLVERQPLDRIVRCRTVAYVLSIGFVVRNLPIAATSLAARPPTGDDEGALLRNGAKSEASWSRRTSPATGSWRGP